MDIKKTMHILELCNHPNVLKCELTCYAIAKIYCLEIESLNYTQLF